MGARSDKLFQKRRRRSPKDLAREKPKTNERSRALIVCEGAKTEPLYIKALVKHLGLTTADVHVSGDCGSAPINVVKHGHSLLKEDPNYDIIFFVFDKDSHESYETAISQILNFKKMKGFKSKIFMAITSVPCFEIWFLMHYGICNKSYVAAGNKSIADCVISDLKQKPEFATYQKAQQKYFDILKDRLEDAKKNSAKRLEQCQAAGEQENHGNPSTKMHLLVEELEKIATEGNI